MHGQWFVLNYMDWSYSVELIKRSRDRCACFYVIYWALLWTSSLKLLSLQAKIPRPSPHLSLHCID